MNQPTQIRWGILGAARINQQLMPAIANANNGELIAIASRRPGAAAQTLTQYAPELNNVSLYNHPQDLINDDRVQAVYIPLAPHEHTEWVLHAIAQGKHVLCEKPLALHVADIEAIQNAAQQHHVKVMEGFMYRFHPQHQRIKAIIDSGIIGEVRTVRTSFAYMMQAARHYRIANSIEQGGGAMWDIGCYAIHAARLHFPNDPAIAVSAMAKLADNGADLGGSGIIDFGDGKYAQFDFGFEHARRAEYQIIGTQGGITCHNVWAKANETPLISWWTEAAESQQETRPLSNHFSLEVEHFNHCLLNDLHPDLTLDDAKINCQIINAALQSIKTGQHVSL